MLKLDRLQVSYGKIQALRDVSLQVRQGEIVSLIGLNGAGKSTLMRTIAGLMRCDSGAIVFQGQPIHNLPPTAIVSRGLALVLEGRSTLKQMSVKENLVLGSYLRRDLDRVDAETEQMLERFPSLRPRLKQSAGTLSGGEQQMLVIARALLSRPKLLMLDEPSLGLAPLVVKRIFDLIRELNTEGLTILLVEQNARQALKLSHRAYVLETGSIVLEGTGAELNADPRVRQAYLGV